MEDSLVPEQMLAEARTDIAAADTKASIVLAGLGIAFGALLAGLIAREWKPSDMRGAGEVLWWVGASLALASVGAAATAVWPRFKTSDVSKGIFYWGHVATFKTLESFASRLEEMPPLTEDRTLHQLWHISRIVRRKYRCVRAALGLSGCAVGLLLLASLLGG